MNFILPDTIILSFIQHLDLKNRLVWSALYPKESATFQARLTQFRTDWACRCCRRHQRNRGRLITPAGDSASRFYGLKHYLLDKGRLCDCPCRTNIRMFLRDCLGQDYVDIMYQHARNAQFIQLWHPYREFPKLRWITRQQLYFTNLTNLTHTALDQRIADNDAHVDMIDGLLDHAFKAQQEDHRYLSPEVVDFDGEAVG
jgi:hypothetical protein